MKNIKGLNVIFDGQSKRLAIQYDDVDESGKVIAPNKRANRVIVDDDVKAHIDAICEYALTIVD